MIVASHHDLMFIHNSIRFLFYYSNFALCHFNPLSFTGSIVSTCTKLLFVFATEHDEVSTATDQAHQWNVNGSSQRAFVMVAL